MVETHLVEAVFSGGSKHGVALSVSRGAASIGHSPGALRARIMASLVHNLLLSKQAPLTSRRSSDVV